MLLVVIGVVAEDKSGFSRAFGSGGRLGLAFAAARFCRATILLSITSTYICSCLTPGGSFQLGANGSRDVGGSTSKERARLRLLFCLLPAHGLK